MGADKMKTLNLDKIRLYCVLHNINSWDGIPSCLNCGKNVKCKIQAVEFHCNFGKNFTGDEIDLKGFGMGGNSNTNCYWGLAGCDHWEPEK